ncbi:MAG: hypothetical protein WBB99_18125, partial [Rhodococcus sp. (in: high G+C Gram-positive bacteria)]
MGSADPTQAQRDAAHVTRQLASDQSLFQHMQSLAGAAFLYQADTREDICIRRCGLGRHLD